jgi:Na+-transporting NADH:ubiquinone oxidoreductase subunit NqrF
VPELIVKGLASNKIIAKIHYEEDDKSLMDFLRANGIRIASSCMGEGVCKRCIVNSSTLSCQMSLKDIKQESFVVEVDYL